MLTSSILAVRLPGVVHNLMKCTVCEDCGWVCENHPDTPWSGEHACNCGGAGMPCPKCNPSDQDHPPRPPTGTRIEYDEDGWRHGESKGHGPADGHRSLGLSH